jgi:hypothetical protein
LACLRIEGGVENKKTLQNKTKKTKRQRRTKGVELTKEIYT